MTASMSGTRSTTSRPLCPKASRTSVRHVSRSGSLRLSTRRPASTWCSEFPRLKPGCFPPSLLMPESNYGPAVLAPKNYFLLKDYNFSDLHVLFVGHLSDRILDPRPFE